MAARPNKALLALFILFAGSAPALAHPHVWVVVKTQVLFGPDGSVTGLRHDWTFDEMYSAFATTGVGKAGQIPTDAELLPLAKTNIDSLDEFNYFTVAKVAGSKVDFSQPTDYSMHESASHLVTLHFTLPLKHPASARKAFTFQVYDPTYFVAFSFDKGNPIALVNAPKGCSVSDFKPKPLDTAESQKLTEAFFANLSPGSNFGIKLAERAIVACP